METDKRVVIRLSGIPEGNHSFNFQLGKSFFEQLEYSEIPDGDVLVSIEMIKRSTFLELEIITEGWVSITCDRCLDFYQQELEQEERLIVKYGKESEELDDNIIVIPEDSHELELSHYMYESIILTLPYKKVHPNKKGENSCDPEMIKKLKSHLINGENEQNDPRWDKLKDFLQNKN